MNATRFITSAGSAAVFLVLAGQAGAETLTVPGQYATIQQALGISSDGDSIEVSPGTYAEAINFLGRDVHVYSTGSAADTFIDATGLNLTTVTFNNNEGPDAILEGFTIRGGSETIGGGVLVEGAGPTLINCVIRNNAADFGGGMYIYNNSSATLTGCTFLSNTAGTYGGGLMLESSSNVSLTSCVFELNTAGAAGGGLWIETCNPTLTSCQFFSNASSQGGGLYNYHAGPTLTDCSFTANHANAGTARFGGAVYNLRGAPVFVGCDFSANTAYRGGAMNNEWCSPVLTDCTFSGNSAAERGGGLYSFGEDYPGSGQSQPVLTGCFFMSNNAVWGGAIANDAHYADGLYGPGTLTSLTDCTFNDNTASRGGAMWSDQGSHATITASLFLGNGATWGGALYHETGSGPTVVDTDFIGNTGQWGGGVHSRNGSNGLFTDCEFIGNYASADGGANYDFHSSPTMTNCLFDSNLANSGAALRHEGTASWPQLTSCSFQNNRAQYNGGAIYAVDAFTQVDDCSFVGNRALVDHGGAIRMVRASNLTTFGLTVEGSVFTNNWAAVYGGAIEAQEGAVSILNTDFEGNESGYGGAVMLYTGSSGIVYGCSFTGNVARGNGGGLYVYNSTPRVDTCTFVQNWSNDHGGGLMVSGSTIVVTGSQFIDNTAWTHGGGVSLNSGSNGCVANSTFSGNLAWQMGGGLYSYASNPTVMNLVFDGNNAQLGGAMASYSASPTVGQVTLSDNIAWNVGHGLYLASGSNAVVNNSVLWDELPDEIFVASGTATVNSSNVWGGWIGPGTGNISVDPEFVDAAAGDLRLLGCSPSVDAGDDTLVPKDLADLNQNGDVDETCPYDLVMNARLADAAVDMGAYEFTEGPCPWDLDGDGLVATSDFLDLLGQWGTCGTADFNRDGEVATSDFLELLGNWGACP